MKPIVDRTLPERKIEFYKHTTEPEWGYSEEQTDTFGIIYPHNYNPDKKYPLCVVVHSAGHDVYTTVECMVRKGNHDVYHVPSDMFGLVPDCRANRELPGSTDWFWGGQGATMPEEPVREGTALQPVEKRVLATLDWTMKNFPINENRVYAVGNSMGGTGSLGMFACRGDIFASITVNVAAGVRHMLARCGFDGKTENPPKLPDLPIILDFSSQCDVYSDLHERLYEAAEREKFQLFGFWGPYGHENDYEKIRKYNDLFDAFPMLTVEKNKAYPVFTKASTNDKIPWPHDRESSAVGQVNAFFRWENGIDTEKEFEIVLKLLRPEEWATRVILPTESTADVSLRRLQSFKVNAGDTVNYTFGDRSGTVTADGNGLITIPSLTVTAEPKVLKLSK